ncbi:hypothetical protein LSH36_503g04040 [Paralvinella palmiformis]|uniref:Uncharacterized protein n=1 Tax=Paralvinella palmiformis TaxID=53620 RepID=A0AAD9MWG9_9ANNE|nr:hypothetical protein LSH36_503g04040 [Paralvinella palmiformis]
MSEKRFFYIHIVFNSKLQGCRAYIIRMAWTHGKQLLRASVATQAEREDNDSRSETKRWIRLGLDRNGL